MALRSLGLGSVHVLRHHFGEGWSADDNELKRREDGTVGHDLDMEAMH